MRAIKTRWAVGLFLLAVSACRREPVPESGPALTSTKEKAAAPGATTALGAPATPPPSEPNRHDLADDPPVPPRPPSDHALQIRASEILIAYRGAKGAGAGVTRTREEAKGLANHVDIQARAGANFEELVLKYSDDPQGRAHRGNLGLFKRDRFDKAFSDAAFELMKQEIIIEPVETDSGFHIIKRTE